MPDPDYPSSLHRTGALSRLLATPPAQKPEVGPDTLLSAVLDAATDGILVIGADSKVLTYNDRFVEIWAVPRHTLLTRDEHQVLAAMVRQIEGAEGFLTHFENLGANYEVMAQGNCRLLDGRILDHETRPVKVKGETIARVWTFRDITARVRAFALLHESEERAVHLASHDSLTDLPNRTFFRRSTDAFLEESAITNVPASVVLIALDRFKSANFLGHHQGDMVLREAARRLQSLVRPIDLVARLGADEFAVLLRGCDVGSSVVLSQQIVARLREPYRIAEENELFLSASVGTASFPLHAKDTGELLRHANIALVAAKERGKDQAVSFEPELTGEAAARLEMNRFLHRSLRDHAFFLEFQPIARTHDLGITGFEALVRSKDLLGRRVPPDAFIPIAEATGLVVPMGRIVLDLALGAIRELNLLRATPLRMAINASAIQLRHPTFVRDIRAGLDAHGLPASSIAVEITETNALSDPEGTRRVLRELREAGVSISLDDFGTGFASLDLLRSLPLDVVKIDRSFTRDIDVDGTQAAIATSLIELSHRLGMKVVAEGVETESQHRFLLSHGCDLIQGYWLARPLSLPASLEFLQSRDRRVRQ